MDSAGLSEAIVQELSDDFAHALRQAGPTLLTVALDAMEQQGHDLGRQVLARVVEQTVATVAAALALSPPVCPQYHAPRRLVDAARERHLQGLVGA